MDKEFVTIVLDKFNKVLFILILLELFLGGGGRMVELGFLTLRMILFFTVLAINIPIFLLTKKIKKYTFDLLILFALPLLFSFIVGIRNGAKLSMIFEDIKPLSYFFSFIFFYININKLSDIQNIIKIIKISSIIMALLYIIAYISINCNLINYSNFYTKLSEYGEFAFRGKQAFFYKGFLFMCIGFFFYFNENKYSSKFIAAIIFIAIILTFMRGFIISLILTYTIYMLFIKKITSTRIILSILMVGFLLSILSYFQTQKIGNKVESNNVRLITFKQVYETTNLTDILIGHGFGIGVPVREKHMEMSYLEIFYKQGIVGLLFWIYVFILTIKYYKNSIKNESVKVATPLLLATFFVYLQSLTNPFINNPIGMSMIIISLISLNILQQKSENNLSLHTNI